MADPGGEGESSPAVDGLFAALASALPFPAAFGTDPVTEVSASATTRLLDMTATPDWLSEGDVWEGLASNATLLAPLVRALPAPPPCKALLGLRLLAFYQDWGEPCLGCVQAADHPLLVLGCLSAFEDQELASGSTYLRAGGSTGYRLLDVPEMCDICTAA
uniref:Uncharacterized protein n=1 Tax=Chlamydomonas leiostraca TaxID=1034604 RepID=A0A7S0RQL1_9CHLO